MVCYQSARLQTVHPANQSPGINRTKWDAAIINVIDCDISKSLLLKLPVKATNMQIYNSLTATVERCERSEWSAPSLLTGRLSQQPVLLFHLEKARIASSVSPRNQNKSEQSGYKIHPRHTRIPCHNTWGMSAVHG